MSQTLITRLSKLDTPDREVDGEIWEYMFGDKPVDFSMPLMEYTASVDAAIALAERVLPGRNRTIRKRYRTTNGLIDGHVYDAHVSGGDVCEGANEAIALCIALLRAKEASKL